MAPRALKNSEKNLQREKIFKSAKELVLLHGLKKISIDDVIHAVGVGKATFYKYFSSKDELLLQLIREIYKEVSEQAKELIKGSTTGELRENLATFLVSIISDQEIVFFFKNHQELEEMIVSAQSSQIEDFRQMEYSAFENLIILAGLDPMRVKPDVVHNYIHSMYNLTIDNAMMKENLSETISVMLNGLLKYIFD